MEHWQTDSDDDVYDPTEDEYKESSIYDISSYGADYPVEMIAARIDSGNWYVPPFQRNYVWSQNQASRFIESLLLGLPVPGIFLFKDAESQQHLIIDGQQRTKTLALYLNGKDFGRSKFKLTNVSEQFEGKTFEELSPEDQLRLSEALIHAIIFKQDRPQNDKKSVIEVFERLNTGGSKLSAQEIRGCVNHGPIVNFLEEITELNSWSSVFISKSKRLKDHELILRFFALWEWGDKYKPPMKSFLDDYMAFRKDLSGPKSDELKAIFSNTLEFIVSNVGNRAFRIERSFNAAVFDSVAVTVARLMQSGNLTQSFEYAYNALIQNPDFIELTSKSTANEENLKKRFELANDYLRD